MEIAFYIEQYAGLTKTFKDLVRLLYKLEIAYKKGKIDHVRRKRDTLASKVDCCLKTISRFNNHVKYFLIAVIERFNKGKQGANEYRIDPEFFKALQLLDLKNLLYKSDKEILEFAKFHRQNENVPRHPPKCPSSLSSSSLSDMSLYGYVHPYLEKIKEISLKDKLFFSRRYSEYAIVQGVEDTMWWWRAGNRPDTTLGAVIHARIRKHMGL